MRSFYATGAGIFLVRIQTDYGSRKKNDLKNKSGGNLNSEVMINNQRKIYISINVVRRLPTL